MECTSLLHISFSRNRYDKGAKPHGSAPFNLLCNDVLPKDLRCRLDICRADDYIGRIAV